MDPNVTLPDTPARPRWTTTTKVVVGVILFVLLALAAYASRIVFAPLVIGAIVAYVFQPVVRLIRRLTRLPLGVATGLMYLILLALVIPIGALLTPVIIDQVTFMRRELIGFARYLNTTLADTTIQVLGFELAVRELVRQVTAALTDFITSVATESIRYVLDAARIVLLVVFTFVIGFYLTRDAEHVLGLMRELIPPDYRADVDRLIAEIDAIWSAFFRGQVFLSLLVTAILTLVSAVLGLPSPLLLGVWGGLLEFLPSIGHAIWGLTVVIIALLEGSSYLPLPNLVFALVVFGAYIAFTQFDLNFLIPHIIGRRVHLHPVVVILGVIIGASVGGVLGVALAAPTIASLRIIVRYLYARLLDLDPFPPSSVPSAPSPVRQVETEHLAVPAPANPSSESD
jgi:predicted PurR-regulated permease PerM